MKPDTKPSAEPRLQFRVSFSGHSSSCLIQRALRNSPQKHWVGCQAAVYILATGQQAESDHRKVAAQGVSGSCQEARTGSPEVWEDPDWGFPHSSWAVRKCIQQAEEDGGWDVSHLASRSRWG